MTTLAKTLETYIKDQLDPEDNNVFGLNECDHPEVISLIKTLNYVSIDFIINHFGEDNLLFSYEGSTIEMMTWPLEYFTIHIQDMNCLFCHSTDLTTTGMSSIFDATDENIARYSKQLSEAIEFINKHYINVIDSLLKEFDTPQDSGHYVTKEVIEEILKKCSESECEQERSDGRKYGYPQCCIDSFCDDLSDISKLMSEERGSRKLTGTGYIPCVDCNEKYTVEQLIDNINTKRDSSIEPFHKNI